MSTDTPLTTILDMGDVIRFRQRNGVAIHGTIVGIQRPQGQVLLQVRRRCDGRVVGVTLGQVLKVTGREVGIVPVVTIEEVTVPALPVLHRGMVVRFTLEAILGEGTIVEVERKTGGHAGVLIEDTNGELFVIDDTDVLDVIGESLVM